MKTKIIKHVILTQDRVINGKNIQRGIVIKNDGCSITSSCGLVLSNFPTVDTEKLWEEVLKIPEEGNGKYIYSHIDYLDDGEKPTSCNRCPHQSFTVGYFDNKNKHETRMSCNAKGISEWNRKKVNENTIRKHFDNKTKPSDCPI